MKILFLAHSFPYPPDEGIRLMSYNLLKEFSKRHSVTLLSLLGLNESRKEILRDEEEKYVSEIEKFCKRVEIVKHRIPRSPFKRLWNIFFQREPFCAYQFYSKEFAQKLPKLVKNGNFDIIHFDYLTSVYRNSANNIAGVFFPHDAISMLFKRNIKGEKNIFRKFYIYTQWKKMVRYEKENIPKFEKTVVVSPKDREWLLNLNLPPVRRLLNPDVHRGFGEADSDVLLRSNLSFDISVIPNGVDCEYFKPFNTEDAESSPPSRVGLLRRTGPRTREEDYPSVIFRGVMNFVPNIDAALYFAKDILPLIRQKVSNLKHYIVGTNPTREIKKLTSDPLTIVTGYVDDIRPYIAQATVNICPMQIGSGIKNKILEAMAMEKPTVATSVACEGIPEVKDGENILIANTPEEFAKKTILLINNESLRKKIGKNTRQFVMKNYTWQKAAEKFEILYQQAIKKSKTSRAPLRVL